MIDVKEIRKTLNAIQVLIIFRRELVDVSLFRSLFILNIIPGKTNICVNYCGSKSSYIDLVIVDVQYKYASMLIHTDYETALMK